jgi:chromosome segregation ATPase
MDIYNLIVFPSDWGSMTTHQQIEWLENQPSLDDDAEKVLDDLKKLIQLENSGFGDLAKEIEYLADDIKEMKKLERLLRDDDDESIQEIYDDIVQKLKSGQNRIEEIKNNPNYQIYKEVKGAIKDQISRLTGKRQKK